MGIFLTDLQSYHICIITVNDHTFQVLLLLMLYMHFSYYWSSNEKYAISYICFMIFSWSPLKMIFTY